MESYSVQAELSAVDKMSPAFRNAASAAESMSQKVSGALSSLGKGTMAVGAVITAFGAKSLKTYGDFSSNINKAAVVAGSSNKKLAGNMKQLTQVAVDMGKELPISIQDASEAMVEMARQGASVGDIKKEFPPIARAAASAGEDLTSVATTVQQSMNIWGGGMKTATKNSATMAIVANKSSASIGDMQQVFANVGTAAKNMGFSLKDVSVATGVMTNAGIPAAQASNDLNHAFTQMIKPSKNAASTMKELGISYTDAQGNMKPLRQIIGEVAKATDGLSDSQKQAAINTLFGTAGAKAMLPLLDSVTDGSHKAGQGWDDMSAAVDKGAGSYAKANKYLQDNAQNMTHNVGDAIDQMKDAWQGLTISAMGESAPVIQKIAQKFANLADTISNMHGPLGDLIKGFIAFAPIIGPVVIAIGAFMTGIGKIVGVVGGAGKALKMFGGKTKAVGTASTATAGQIAAMGLKAAGIGVGIGAATAGIGVFAMGVAKLASTGQQGITALSAMTTSIVILAGTFALLNGPLDRAVPGMLGLSTAMLSAGASAMMIGGAIALAGEGINLAGGGVLRLAQAFILLSTHMQMIVPVMTAVGVGFAGMVTGFITALASRIPQVALAMGQMMLRLLTTISMYLPQMIQKGITIVTELLNGLAQGLPRIVEAAANLITNFLNSLTQNLPRIIVAGTKFIVAILNGIAKALPKIIEAATNVIVKFLGSLTKSVPRLIPAGVKFIVAVLEGIAKNIPKLAGAALKVVLKFLGWLTDNAGKIIKAGVKFILAVVKGVGDNLGRIAKAALDLLQKFLNTLLKSLNRIIDMGIKFVESVVEGIGKRVGQMPGEGLKLIKLFIRGVVKGLTGSRRSGKDNANAVKDGVSGISLFKHGSAIIGSFLKGLKSKFEGVKSFVGGIASWIKKHKGPISYDRKLLIPAGKAIMNGLNAGLNTNFRDVQKNVGSMAGAISKTANNALDSSVQALNSRIRSGSITNDITGQLSVKQQPAIISLDLGGSNYTAFVDDISHKQGKLASLKRTYRV